MRNKNRKYFSIKCRHGFVLLATLWTLAALALFVAYFATRIDRSVIVALQMQEQMQAELEEQATLNTLVYLGLTRTLNIAGLKTEKFEPATAQSNPFEVSEAAYTGAELRLDRRPYKGLGESYFSLQDAGSLISLRENLEPLRQLLLQRDISESQATTLLGRLQDYTDRDDFLSLNGAERRDYESLGYLVPTNRFLVSPLQLLNIPGWKEWLGTEQAQGIMDELTIYPGSRLNYNSMTRAGMSANSGSLGNLEPQTLTLLLEGRQEQPYRNIADVNQQAGTLIPYDPLGFSLFPTNHLQVRLWHEKRKQIWLTGVTLDPNSLSRPWFIDYRLDINVQPGLYAPLDDLTTSSIPATPLLR